MADGALSEEMLQSGLRDIRLPPEAAGGALAEAAAALALACIAALLIGGLLRLASTRRAPPEQGLRDELARLSTLPEGPRRAALLHLLKRHAPDRFAALKPALYRPGFPLGAQELHRELEPDA